ncbi:sensor histidine kinase [Halobacteriovorax sp.]|uniref:sensor histidine kinase n=1 Tax=Halobacteriovorax sp. TaxID=2020862 RepID=UPI003564C496
MEVSNATLTAYIETLKEHNVDPCVLVSGTSLTFEEISNPKGKITWKDFETITNNTFDTVGEEKTLTSLKITGVDNDDLSVLKKICASTIRTEGIYWFFCACVAKLFYKNLTFEYKKVKSGHVQLKIIMKRGHKCFSNFTKAYASAFEGFPTMIGLGPAQSSIDETSPDPIINLYFKNTIGFWNPFSYFNRFFSSKTNVAQLLSELDAGKHEQDLLNKELKNLNEELKDSNRLNESLLRTIMHDLNNPLAIMRLKAEKLLNESEDFNKKDKEVLNRASENMYQVINDLKNFHLAKCFLQDEVFNILECIKDSRGHFQEKIEEKKLDVIIKSSLQNHFTLKGNKVTFTNSILSNLLSNSIKFSFEGGTIYISADEVEDAVIITVKDNGTGMTSSAVENFFNSNLSESEKGTSGELGLGIGLTQVAYFTKQMNGKIIVNSKSYSKHPKDHGTEIKLIFKTDYHELIF